MAYTGRDWDNTGTKVTKEDFKRMEKGIKANDSAITEQANQINALNGVITALTTKTSFSCIPATGFTIASQNCYKINDEIVFNVDVKKTDGSDIGIATQMLFTLPYTPSAEFPVTTIARSSAYGLMNSFIQTVVNTSGQAWSMVNAACGYVSVSGRFEL